MDIIEYLHQVLGKIEEEDFTVSLNNGKTTIKNLRVYRGDLEDTFSELGTGWDYTIKHVIDDLEGEDQMDILQIEIFQKPS